MKLELASASIALLLSLLAAACVVGEPEDFDVMVPRDVAPPEPGEKIERPPATFYVNAATGANSNNGRSPTTAFKTIQAGVSAARPGQIVEVANGTYFESVHIANKGTTAAKPIWGQVPNFV